VFENNVSTGIKKLPTFFLMNIFENAQYSKSFQQQMKLLPIEFKILSDKIF